MPFRSDAFIDFVEFEHFTVNVTVSTSAVAFILPSLLTTLPNTYTFTPDVYSTEFASNFPPFQVAV